MFSDFSHAAYYSILMIGALTGLFLIIRVSAPFKWLAALLMVTLVNELLARYCKYTLRISNNPVYHIFTVLEFALYAIIYRYFLPSSKWKRILNFSVLGFVLFELINLVFFQPITMSNTNSLLLEGLLLIFFSLNLFLQIRSDMTYQNLLTEGVFWFNCAILFYYSVTILNWGFQSLKVYDLPHASKVLYTLLRIFNCILYSLLILSLILDYIKIKSAKTFT